MTISKTIPSNKAVPLPHYHLLPAAACGLTLIELVAGVAIIALLTMIAMPTISNIRNSGRTAIDASNLRQLGIASQLFLADHDNVMFPHTNFAGANWDAYLNPYIPNRETALRKRVSLYSPYILDIFPNDNTHRNRTGYSKNGHLGTMEGKDVRTVKRITDAYDPAKVVLFWNDTQPSSAHGGWPSNSGGSYYNFGFWHNNRVHILFLDGHIEALPIGDTRKAKDYPQFQWGPFVNYPTVPAPSIN